MDPAPTPNPAPAPDPSPAPSPAPTSWTDGFSQDDLGYVQTKGFKDPASLLSSYRNFEKLQGVPQDRILKLPGEGEPLDPVYERLGRPKDPTGYEIPLPEGDDGKFAEGFKPVAHKAGLTNAQVKELATWWNGQAAESTKAQQEQAAQRDAAEVQALKGEWGANYDKNDALVNRAIEAFGMSKDELLALRSTLGPAKAMKFIHNIGVKLGSDDTFVTGESAKQNFGGMTADQAKSRINELRNDAGFTQKYLAGDMNAKQEMSRLHQIAYG